MNEIAGNLIKPRSFNVYNGNLVPGSFLGMLLLYGLIGKITGIWLAQFLTPLLAVLGVILFYKILLKVFEPKIALISALLMFSFPAWWYYANFPMVPNIAFITCLLAGFYFLVNIKPEFNRINFLWVALASVFLALGMTIRTNEFLWVSGIVVLLAAVNYKMLRWHYLLIFSAAFILVFTPVFYFNHLTYGNFLSFGYLRLESGLTLGAALPTEFKTTSSDWFNLAGFIFFPFGIHPRVIMANLSAYLLRLFSIFFVSALAGFVIFLKKYSSRNQALYFLSTLAAGSYLLIYYGSWVLEDTLTMKLNLLGVSYVRYFLPIYLMALPYAAICIIWLIGLFKNKIVKLAVAVIIVITIFAGSLNLLYRQGEDNLLKKKENLTDNQQILRQVITLTEDNAVIISQHSDKVFFPGRKVIGRWEPNDYAYFYKMLEQDIPLYYYAYEGREYIDQLNLVLAQFEMQFGKEQKITDKESLYQIKLIDYEKVD